MVVFANSFVKDVSACEDLVQDTFFELWKGKLTFKNEIALRAYLYKVTRNKCYNILKHEKVKQKYASKAIITLENEELVDEEIVSTEMTRLLREGIKQLHPRKKQIIELSLEGLTNQEIAEQLGIKLQTVKTLRSDAYKMLRAYFNSISVD